MSTPVTPAGRPSRRRRVLGALLLLWPVAELAVLIQVGRVVGVAGTLLLLLAGAVAGSLVLRHVGTATVRRLAAAARREPVAGTAARPAAETALLVVAGLLLIVPGYLSDVVGLVLLVPGLRRAVARRAGDAVVRRLPLRSVRVVQGQVLDGEHVDVQVTDVTIPGSARRPGPPPPPLTRG